MFFSPYIVIQSRLSVSGINNLNGDINGVVSTYPSNNTAETMGDKWIVTLSELNNQESFTLKNQKTGQYLYVNAHGEAKSSKDVILTNMFSWKVFPVDNNQHFYFRNLENKRILDCNDFVDCVDSTTKRCSIAHAYRNYTGSDYQKWDIL